MVRRLLPVLVALLAGVPLLACDPAVYVEAPLARLLDGPGPGSQLVGCERAAEVVTVTVDSHLDPACRYTGGFEITASDVTLDCRGATVEDVAGNRPRGILVTAPTTVALHDVTIRNCTVRGFTNTIRVSRAGFKSLAPGQEYLAPFRDILIENSHLYASRGSGIFVDGYVTGVTMRHLDIAGAGSVGIYLEAGSKDNVVEANTVHDNGFGDVRPEGIPFPVGGVEFRYHSTGREGIAVDGSRDNRIVGNSVFDNSAGGIFLYKNCGEYATQKPAQWWTRRYGADGNLIEGNVISSEPDGVWVGSRMAENQYFMDCSDPAYLSASFVRVHRDMAAGNTVRGNRFIAVTRGIRVEDDRTAVEGNAFLASPPGGRAVMVGSKFRTELLGEPVSGTVVRDNATDAAGDAFVWIHGHEDTVVANNRAGPAPAALVEGEQPPIDPFLFVKDLWMP